MFGLGRSECHKVARVLQDYLDGEADDLSTSMVSKHLETCRRCGLEASTYDAIKTALQLSGTPTTTLDPDAVDRLRSFAEDLTGRDG